MSTRSSGAGIIMAWSVEFLQNIPLVSAFIYGYAHFVAGRAIAALLLALAGGTTGALLIRYTEPWIDPGPIEKTAETLTNLASFSLAIPLFIYYFSLNSIPWPVDLALAFTAGTTLSILQARAAGKRATSNHLIAMVLSISAAMLLIRFWGLTAAPLAAAVTLTGVLTTLIFLIEYRMPAD